MNRILDGFLRRIVKAGRLEIIDADGQTFTYGNGIGRQARVRFNDAAVSRDLLLNPTLKLAESYMDGRIVVEDGSIYDFIMLVLQSGTEEMPHWQATLRQHFGIAARRISQFNPPGRSRRNVQHHYDLGDDLYTLFLDEDWQYSCAYYEHPDATLEEAQLAKKRHIAAKMALKPGQRVLDIGCGWGGLGLYLGRMTGADVTGVTLSDQQLARARRRAADAGVADHVRFDLRDYRHVEGTFDRIVSVGMFEHVGVGHYPEFFQTCRKLLADDGVMLLHTIGRTGPPGATNPFIAKYIFPGGYIPSLSEVMPVVERLGLIVTDVEMLRLHYADTLRDWRERFLANWDTAAALYDERFCRMWDMYLAGCEASFRVGDFVVFQIQIAKNVDVLPMTRDYMLTAERALKDTEARVLAAPEPERVRETA